jgi:hypothetical protein
MVRNLTWVGPKGTSTMGLGRRHVYGPVAAVARSMCLGGHIACVLSGSHPRAPLGGLVARPARSVVGVGGSQGLQPG